MWNIKLNYSGRLHKKILNWRIIQPCIKTFTSPNPSFSNSTTYQTNISWIAIIDFQKYFFLHYITFRNTNSMCQKNVRSRENKNISVLCGEVIISHNSNVHVAFTSGPIFYITKHFCIKTWLLKLKLYPRSANFVVFCVWGDYTWSAELCHPIVFTK